MRDDSFHKVEFEFYSKEWVEISKEGEGWEKVFYEEETISNKVPIVLGIQ